MSRSKPLSPPRDRNGRARPGTLKEWGVPGGAEPFWQLNEYELDLLQVQVPAQLHIFNTAEIWKLCPLKGCRRAGQCTGTPRDRTADGKPGMIRNRPPCLRPPHIYGRTDPRDLKPMGRQTREAFTACWDAFREVMHALRDDIFQMANSR